MKEEGSHDLKISADNLSRQFGVETIESDSLTETLLLKHLKRVVDHLLDHDFNKLLIILYRIDIREEKVKQILCCTPAGEIGETLAKAILEREYAKNLTRKAFRD